ncbi:MAG TPA: hypothetical protein DDZ88_25205 [Verrucomicrobiales bacterium]|nr:hypothetical protein [Verrucomicrobiales bacterium]
MHRPSLFSFVILISSFVIPPLATAATPAEVSTALTKAVSFFHSKAAAHGGYVYRYSADFTLREAEGIPGPDTIWIQPPGTPAVGMAMLDAYEATKDEKCLKAAVEAARCVSRTQLASGGWDYSGHFDMKNRSKWLYRRDLDGQLIERRKIPQSEGGWHVWRQGDHKDSNGSTFDDDVSQAATRLLVRVDHALDGKDAEIKEAADFALHTIIMTQYPAGGWSANFDDAPTSPPPVDKYPIKPGNYPADWPRKWPKDFTGCYVLNDNTHATLMSTLLLAWELRGDPKYLDAAKRGGDFLVTAQMPDPQPAWGQQYNAEMQPVWSRQFEPTAISGRESQAAMWALLKLAAATGDKKYLPPVAKAITYLRTVLLPGNQLARFYELNTNKPLYFERGPGGKGFELTYSDQKASSNYGWVWDSELDALQAIGSQIAKGEMVTFPRTEKERWSSPPTDADIATILKEQAPDGSWPVTDDERGWMRDAAGKKTKPAGGVIYSLDFIENVKSLSAWLKAKGGVR